MWSEHVYTSRTPAAAQSTRRSACFGIPFTGSAARWLSNDPSQHTVQQADTTTPRQRPPAATSPARARTSREGTQGWRLVP